MLTSSSSSSQYLHPDYFRPLTPTENSKPSPLTLLAQTCNSIGRDATSTSSGSAAKSKSVDEAKTPSGGAHGRPDDSPSDAERRSTSRDRPQIDVEKAPAVVVVAATRLTASPVDVVATSGPSTAAARTTSTADSGRRRGRSPSPVKASPPPLGSPSPPQHGKPTADHRSKSALHCGADPDGLYAMQYLAAVAALQRQSAVDAGLLPYLAAQRLPVPLHPFALSDRPSPCAGVGPLSPAAARLKPGSCSDPRCSRCVQLGAAATSTRVAGCVGCSQCGNHHHPSTSSSSSASAAVLPPGGHGAFAAALSALSRLPPPPPPGTDSPVVGAASSTSALPPPPSPAVHTCNWLHPGGAYCGHRFSTVDELMQHLHSHCGGGGGATAEPSAAAALFAPDVHPVAAGSLFAPLAVLYGAASSYPPLDLIPSVLAPPVQLPSTTVGPPSVLRQHQQHVAARYHPYRVPPTLLPPSAGTSAAYPSSLAAAYYGALCGIAPGSNGTVPALRL